MLGAYVIVCQPLIEIAPVEAFYARVPIVLCLNGLRQNFHVRGAAVNDTFVHVVCLVAENFHGFVDTERSGSV